MVSDFFSNLTKTLRGAFNGNTTNNAESTNSSNNAETAFENLGPQTTQNGETLFETNISENRPALQLDYYGILIPPEQEPGEPGTPENRFDPPEISRQYYGILLPPEEEPGNTDAPDIVAQDYGIQTPEDPPENIDPGEVQSYYGIQVEPEPTPEPTPEPIDKYAIAPLPTPTPEPTPTPTPTPMPSPKMPQRQPIVNFFRQQNSFMSTILGRMSQQAQQRTNNQRISILSVISRTGGILSRFLNAFIGRR